jgi:hypothetical protein
MDLLRGVMVYFALSLALQHIPRNPSKSVKRKGVINGMNDKDKARSHLRRETA